MPRASACAPALKSSDPFSLAHNCFPVATALAELGQLLCALRYPQT
jgi:hypothetical protein